ncbi:unnamed protein product [Lampetra fluviatilis]
MHRRLHSYGPVRVTFLRAARAGRPGRNPVAFSGSGGMATPRTLARAPALRGGSGPGTDREGPGGRFDEETPPFCPPDPRAAQRGAPAPMPRGRSSRENRPGGGGARPAAVETSSVQAALNEEGGGGGGGGGWSGRSRSPPLRRCASRTRRGRKAAASCSLELSLERRALPRAASEQLQRAARCHQSLRRTAPSRGTVRLSP